MTRLSVWNSIPIPYPCLSKIQIKPDGLPRTCSPTKTCSEHGCIAGFHRAADIDDVIQEAFVRALKAREEGILRSPKAFLYATARNYALDSMRHSSVSRTEYLEQNDLCEFEDFGAGVQEIVARNQELEILTKAIQSMPDRCRQVFTLRKVYGMAQRDIAKKLNISRNTVSAQMTTGLRKFTQYMETYCTERDRL